MCKLSSLCLTILLSSVYNINLVKSDSRQSLADLPELPSHLPSPSKPSSPGFSAGGSFRPGAEQQLFGRLPSLPPPQNQPQLPLNSIPHMAPFGLNQVILILLPQFKTRVQNMPNWAGSTVKFSFPITVFFDKLDVPPGSTFPLGQTFFRNGHFVKRSTERKKKRGYSLPLNESIHGAERAVLIPRLEKLLKSVGLGGKSCLLRAICEVHEFPLHKGYGLLGEVLTMFFSISRSVFADSHLTEYLQAEEAGKSGECSTYFDDCSESMFFWEEKNKYSSEMQQVFHK